MAFSQKNVNEKYFKQCEGDNSYNDHPQGVLEVGKVTRQEWKYWFWKGELQEEYLWEEMEQARQQKAAWCLVSMPSSLHLRMLVGQSITHAVGSLISGENQLSSCTGLPPGLRSYRRKSTYRWTQMSEAREKHKISSALLAQKSWQKLIQSPRNKRTLVNRNTTSR